MEVKLQPSEFSALGLTGDNHIDESSEFLVCLCQHSTQTQESLCFVLTMFHFLFDFLQFLTTVSVYSHALFWTITLLLLLGL